MDSTFNSTKAETIQGEEEKEHSTPSFLIGIIVVSVFVGVCLIAVTYLLVRRMQVKKNRGEIEMATEKPTDTTATTSSLSAIVTTATASTKNEKRPASVAPIVSSLDTNDIFFSILEHPPRPPPMTVRNNLDHLYPPPPVMFEEGYCLNSAFTDFNSLHSDPISASLARQREDRRMSYYITPSSLSQTKLNDERQLMRQLSVSSYQVW